MSKDFTAFSEYRNTYVIAEMACSHEGDPALARQIIDGAGKAAADAVQFQIWSLADMVVPHHPDYELLNRIEMTREQWSDLAQYLKSRFPDMDIIACVYENKGVDIALEIGAEAFKIHSSDLSNPDLIHRIAGTGKRIDLSIGASTLDEIKSAIEWIRNVSFQTELWLMYGYQVFPTPTEAIHLSFLKKLKTLFELPVGYQDHSEGGSAPGFWLPAMAMGIGADCLEKHITHDRSKKGIDHQAALNPDEFHEFVQMVRTLDEAKGVPVPRPFIEQELSYRKNSKKSIVAARDIEADDIVEKKDLLYMRSDVLGLPPDRAANITGRRAVRPIKQYSLIHEEDMS